MITSDSLQQYNTDDNRHSTTAGYRHTATIGRNSLYLISRTLLTMAISLYVTRLALRLLGQTDFGIYYLVAGFVIFFGFLNISMEQSITRFFIYEKSTGTRESMRRMFRVAMSVQACITALMLTAGETIGVWYLNNRLVIPAESIYAANIIYQLSLLTLALNFIKVPYNAIIIAYEKMSFYAFLGMGEVLMRLAGVLMLLWFGSHLLIIYSIQFLFVTATILCVYLIYCSRSDVLNHICRNAFWLWDAAVSRRMLAFCGWSTLGSGSFMASFHGMALILNQFFGVAANAAFGVMTMMYQAVFKILTSFRTAFSPELVSRYALNDMTQLRQLIYRLGKYSFFLAGALLVPLCLNMDAILEVWIGEDVPEFTSSFCILSLTSAGIECIAVPGLVCNQATGNVRNFNIIWSLILLSNLPLAILFLLESQWAPAVFVSKIIISGAALIFITYMMHRQIRLSIPRYLIQSILRPAMILLPSLAAAWWVRHVSDSAIAAIYADTGIFWLLFSISVFALGLDADERKAFATKLSATVPLRRAKKTL